MTKSSIKKLFMLLFVCLSADAGFGTMINMDPVALALGRAIPAHPILAWLHEQMRTPRDQDPSSSDQILEKVDGDIELLRHTIEYNLDVFAYNDIEFFYDTIRFGMFVRIYDRESGQFKELPLRLDEAGTQFGGSHEGDRAKRDLQIRNQLLLRGFKIVVGPHRRITVLGGKQINSKFVMHGNKLAWLVDEFGAIATMDLATPNNVHIYESGVRNPTDLRVNGRNLVVTHCATKNVCHSFELQLF
jgi:hypothetical protein